MGRPRLKIDPGQIEKLAGIGCTVEEIASVVGCDKRTLERRYAAEIDKGRNAAKATLRKAQFQNAVNRNNAVMQIWLGKQMLGQKDKQEVHHSVEEKQPAPEVVNKIVEEFATKYTN